MSFRIIGVHTLSDSHEELRKVPFFNDQIQPLPVNTDKKKQRKNSEQDSTTT